MTDERRSEGEPEATDEPGRDSSGERQRRPSEDLAEGLELMLRAARKAVRGIDSTRIEELGRRALRSVEGLDRQKVQDLGRKAAKNLDPRKIEEVAEEAGRELLAVVERVAERVEGIVSGSRRSSTPPPAADAEASSDDADAPTRRMRVDGTDKA
jgi:hypothetical protein